MKKPEYHEGPETVKRFERLATAILQAPGRSTKKKKKQAKPASSRKRKPHGKS